MSTDPNPLDCPYCGGASGGQRITGSPSKVAAWSCTACGTDWAITVANLHLRPAYADLATAAARRSGGCARRCQQVIELANHASTLTDEQLQHRLLTPAASCLVSWYLRSTDDRDTHYAGQLRDGRAHALCGARFRPIELTPLPGLPPDGGQICVICYRATLRNRG